MVRPLLASFGCFDEALERWWLHWLWFWVTVVVLLLRGPGEEEEGRGRGEAGDFEIEVGKGEDREVVVVRLPAVGDRLWWLSMSVVGQRHHRGSTGWCFGGYHTVYSRWEPLVAVDTRGWSVQGCQHHRGSKEWCFGLSTVNGSPWGCRSAWLADSGEATSSRVYGWCFGNIRLPTDSP